MPHIHDDYDFIVNAFIVHNNKVLLVNHPRYGAWLTPGGHVELDEDPEIALVREAKEETGLDIEVFGAKAPLTPSKDRGYKFLHAPQYMDVHDAQPPHRHIALNYFVKAKSSQAMKSDEHEDMRWFSENDLDDPAYALSEAVKFYCLEALNFFR